MFTKSKNRSKLLILFMLVNGPKLPSEILTALNNVDATLPNLMLYRLILKMKQDGLIGFERTDTIAKWETAVRLKLTDLGIQKLNFLLSVNTE
ncbi:MAG: hypothetical protein HC888_03995 [Candidatus Competibacteraceae bacterium]|nr:hypothetical protein [Candidatus Competibacteraceae bacterium]